MQDWTSTSADRACALSSGQNKLFLISPRQTSSSSSNLKETDVEPPSGVTPKRGEHV